MTYPVVVIIVVPLVADISFTRQIGTTGMAYSICSALVTFVADIPLTAKLIIASTRATERIPTAYQALIANFTFTACLVIPPTMMAYILRITEVSFSAPISFAAGVVVITAKMAKTI